MPGQGGAFTVDFTDFNKKFRDIVGRAIPELADEGFFKAGNELLRLAIEEEPKAPHDTGRLVSAKEVIVIKGGGGCVAGFNVEYACKLHEMPAASYHPANWKLPGSGPKFLETKVIKYRQDLIKVVADTIRAGAR